jgi:SAM-dependent methyltransferase
MDRDAWDARYRERELLWTADPNRFLVECVDGLTPGEALDIACGEGRNAVWLAERGWRVTAVDWSAVALDRGRTLAQSRGVAVDFVEEDLDAWVPRPASADLVVVVYLHIPDPGRERVWRLAAEAVRTGGRIVVIGHDSTNLTEGYGGPADSAVLYTASDVAASLPARFVVERSERVRRPVDTEDGMRVALDNVVVAVREE